MRFCSFVYIIRMKGIRREILEWEYPWTSDDDDNFPYEYSSTMLIFKSQRIVRMRSFKFTSMISKFFFLSSYFGRFTLLVSILWFTSLVKPTAGDNATPSPPTIEQVRMVRHRNQRSKTSNFIDLDLVIRTQLISSPTH